MNKQAIGIFDSGVGGLSVWQEIAALMPYEDLLYFADSGNCPYGVRPSSEIQALTEQATAFLLEQGAKAVVIACNTASTASVAFLREKWRHIPIIGMVPAVKPAALTTKTGKIGILATQATLNAPALQEVVARFAKEVAVLAVAPPGLVELIEVGKLNAPETQNLLREYLLPLKAQGMDVLVLGCTHFPFLRPILTQLLGDTVTLVDSGAAVARQTYWVLQANNLLAPYREQGLQPAPLLQSGARRFFSTGAVEQVLPVMAGLLGCPSSALRLEQVK